jgi:hypothetical protein
VHVKLVLRGLVHAKKSVCGVPMRMQKQHAWKGVAAFVCLCRAGTQWIERRLCAPLSVAGRILEMGFLS